MTTRAAQIDEAFRVFHHENPRVWQLFERFTLELIARGYRHYSSDAVVQRIRWHTDVETTGPLVKINNNYRAHYARMFHRRHPEHVGFFRNRFRVSTGRRAYRRHLEAVLEPDSHE